MKIKFEEAESRLKELLEILRERDLIEPENDETLLMAIAALRFQERHQWRRLDNEDPPEDGQYCVAIPLLGGHHFIDTSEWIDNEKHFCTNTERITHWAYLLDNPTEEA